MAAPSDLVGPFVDTSWAERTHAVGPVAPRLELCRTRIERNRGLSWRRWTASGKRIAPRIGPWLGKAYTEIAGVLAGQGGEPSGPPFARYHPLGNGRHEVEAGFPVATAIKPVGAVHPSLLPGGPVAVTTHIGPYDEMEPAYAALAAWVSDHGGEPTGDAWESYLSNPEQQPDPSTWRTEVVQPYRIR